jgi:hypothetical protein
MAGWAPLDGKPRLGDSVPDLGPAELDHYQNPRIRELAARLADMVSRGERMLAEFEGHHLAIREAIESDTRRVLECSSNQVHQFEQRNEQLLQDFERDAAALLDACAAATRAAEDTVTRTEGRLDAFNDGFARLISTSAEEIRRAAEAVNGSRASDTGGVRLGAFHDERAAFAEASARESTLPPRRPLILRLVGAALVVLIASLYGAYLHRQTSQALAAAAVAQRTAEDARVVAEQQAMEATASSQRATANALALAVKAERMVAVMAAPDTRRMALIGGRDAPAATGQALWSRSHGVIITAARVPPPAAGQVYQVWLITSRGPVSLGFAAPDAQGRIGVTFDIPLELSGDVTGFLLTKEAAGGSTAPGDSVVLSS